MNIPFFARDSLGNRLEGLEDVAEFTVLQRLNDDETVTPFMGEAPDIVEHSPGAYHVVFPEVWLEPGSWLEYEIDLGPDAFPRLLEGRLSGDEIESLTQSPSQQPGGIDLSMKRGDLLPAFERVLRDENGHPLDLTGKTVTFRLREQGGSVLKVDAEAELVNAEKGRVRYVWEGTDTSQAGLFDAEFVVEHAGGDGPRTLPQSYFYVIEIISTLAD